METMLIERSSPLDLLTPRVPGASHVGLELDEDGAEWSETTYEYRIFLPRCETYAIRYNGSNLTGVYGPLEYDEVQVNALPDYSYEEQIDAVGWVKSNISDFVPFAVGFEECECMLWI